MKKWIFISALALSAIFCNLPGTAPTPVSTSDTMPTLVAAVTASAEALVTPTGAALTGTVTGRLSYPADSMPAMRVTAFEVNTGKVIHIDTALGQSTYSIELPAGTYHIVAYSIEGNNFPSGIASGYTRAVPCGLAVECADHTLIDVTITAGTTIPDINPGDSYAPEGTFPPMPEEQ